jgi:hypothetical protein
MRNLLLELTVRWMISYLRSHKVTILHGPELFEQRRQSTAWLPGQRARGDQSCWTRRVSMKSVGQQRVS